jgi:hypothetical protein
MATAVSSALRVLSVRQPYADLILRGVKDVENRSRPTNYRGLLLIHASKSAALAKTLSGETVGDDERWPDWQSLAYGAIVGAVELTECLDVRGLSARKRAAISPFANGPYCWRLAGAQQWAKPVPCTGQVGLWRPPAGLRIP